MKREPIIPITQESVYLSSTKINEVKYPFLFVKELAYLIESYGSDTDDASKSVLYLYLHGASSIPLAVEYAERNSQHSHMLWTYLVSFCLGYPATPTSKNADGSLFGTLIEVAARQGADLSFLVAQIPNGLQVEGIRPKLVSAIKDYRLKVKIYDAVKAISCADKVHLMRDLHHISRRAKRVQYKHDDTKSNDTNHIPISGFMGQKRSPVFLPIR